MALSIAGRSTNICHPEASHAEDPPPTNDDNSRIPVYAPWHRNPGPSLSVGCLTAAARTYDDGRLNEHFEIHRPLEAGQVTRLVSNHQGPAVLLCSDYVWSVERNLELSRLALSANPDLLIVHGGPSAPARAEAAKDFLSKHGDAVHVLARGEGEELVCDLLGALAPPQPWSLASLTDVAGLTIRFPSGEIQRTLDRPRIADLSRFASPYATGEFDSIPIADFVIGVTVETNRGCPYGCTFCDWGSATMSRVRQFPVERVLDELKWAADHGASHIVIADANFGRTKRDAELIDAISVNKESSGHPYAVSFAPAKNTVRHLVRIMETLRASGIEFETSIGVQSFDPTTLDAVNRSNISTDRMWELSRELRERDLPLPFELIVGLPGQTADTLAADLQLMFDAEVSVRTHNLRVLPNAPIGDPDYQRKFDLKVDSDGYASSSSTFAPDERDEMTRLIRMAAIIDHFAVLRLVARWLQWDHNIPATSFASRLAKADEAGGPLTRFSAAAAELLTGVRPLIDWSEPLDEIKQFVIADLGVPLSSALTAVFAAQHQLLPSPDMRYPAIVPLEHDVISYGRSAGWGLLGNGSFEGPSTRLDSLGPGELIVRADPLQLGARVHTTGQGPFPMSDSDTTHLTTSCYELLSPLTSPTAFFRMCSELGEDEQAELRSYRDTIGPRSLKAAARPSVVQSSGELYVRSSQR